MNIETLNLIITGILSAVGLYLAHNIQRQVALRVAEKRMDAYAKMWSKMDIASPTRIAEWKQVKEPLSSAEREKLFNELVEWYYKDGNGMLLGDGTRTMYLTVKDNLVCRVDYFEPPMVREKLKAMSLDEQEKIRGYYSIRQLSLLRTRMRADLEVYGKPYRQKLDKCDRAFLRACEQKLTDKPWSGSIDLSDNNRCLGYTAT